MPKLPKLGTPIRPIALPENFPAVPEVDEFNRDVLAYTSLPPIATDPFAVEDFTAFFGEVFSRLKQRCLLHRRRAALVAADGPVLAVVKSEIQRCREAIRLRREAAVDSVISGETGGSAGGKGEVDPVQKLASEHLTIWQSIQHGMSKYGYRDEDAAAKCERLLFEKFGAFLVASDL
jgi:hypothetical protein